MKYGILGSGTANSKVTQDGLIDIRENDPKAIFVVHARRAPQGSVSDVYDFLVDNEVPFIAVTRVDDKAPKALVNCAIDVVTTDDPAKEILAQCDIVLLLWDEENEESSNRLATMSHDAGKGIKDLTMALTPIIVEGAEPVEEVVPVKVGTEEEYAIVGFTRDELLNMNIGVLRRQAKSLGVENVGKTKQEIVDSICAISNDNREVDIDTDMSGEFVVATDVHNPSDIGNGFFTWLENGEVQCHPLPPIMVKWLIEELKTA
jgi:hypothetical protein